LAIIFRFIMTDSNTYGGYGGTAFTQDAPEGTVITGFYLAKNTNYLEYIRPGTTLYFLNA
jgi:hypothetical protein